MTHRPDTENLPPHAPSGSVGGQLEGFATAMLEQARQQLGRPGARRHAGIHQARKAIRRTRAALALGHPQLGAGAMLIDRQLKKLNTGLSGLRDAQALVEALDRLQRDADDPARLALLQRARAAAVASRDSRLAQALGEDAGLGSRRERLAVLRAGLQALPWQNLDSAGVDAALDRTQARTIRAAEAVRTRGRDTDWHRWRRRERRLSQQHSALGRRYDKGAKRSLNTPLGHAQDHTLVLEHCGRDSPFDAADRPALRRLASDGLGQARARLMAAASRLRFGKAAGTPPADTADTKNPGRRGDRDEGR